MTKIGTIQTEKSIENAMREIRQWLSRIGVSGGFDVDLKYDARMNVALLKFKYNGKNYEYRSTSQKNYRLNMHAIARVMEFKVRAHLMGIEKFDVSMSPYLALTSRQDDVRADEPINVVVDPYAVLGISSLASNEEVELCYRRMAKAWHPDMANSEEAKAVFLNKFSEINEAHQKIKAERGA